MTLRDEKSTCCLPNSKAHSQENTRHIHFAQERKLQACNAQTIWLGRVLVSQSLHFIAPHTSPHANAAFDDLTRKIGWLDAMALHRDLLAIAVQLDSKDKAGEELRRIWYEKWLESKAKPKPKVRLRK